MTDQWTNDRGNTVTSTFGGESRYEYDAKLCKTGFEQYDTNQDAPYFGVWVHIAKRQIVTYAEGDLMTVGCATAELFKAELQSMADFYGDPPPAFTTLDIDAGVVTRHYADRPVG